MEFNIWFRHAVTWNSKLDCSNVLNDCAGWRDVWGKCWNINQVDNDSRKKRSGLNKSKLAQTWQKMWFIVQCITLLWLMWIGNTLSCVICVHAANPLRTSLVWFICINVVWNARNRVDVKAQVQSNKKKKRTVGVRTALHQFYSFPADQ